MANIVEAIGLKHPITYNTYDLCDLHWQNRLVSFNVQMIKKVPDVSGLLSLHVLHQWKMPLHWTRVILFKYGNIWSARWKSSLK